MNAKADYDNSGATLDLGGQTKCKGTLNQCAITRSVARSPPATPYPVSSTGDNLVVCDGQWHSFALTVLGTGYDAGPAKATVTATPVAGSPGQDRDYGSGPRPGQALSPACASSLSSTGPDGSRPVGEGTCSDQGR